MSWQPTIEPQEKDAAPAALDMVIEPRSRDLGDGFEVRRVLPFAKRRQIGPFVFFDQFATAFAPGQGLDVRPHPHIGLATVTYLFEGEILHRDSLGNRQPIRPGAVNWMIAGRGIAHSERTPPEIRERKSRLFGAQLWVALPQHDEEIEPGFTHHPRESLPLIEGDGARIRVIAGSFGAARSPVAILSPTLCADAELAAGARLVLPPEHAERSAYIVSGEIECGGERYAPGRLLVFHSGGAVTLAARMASRLLLLGGAALDGERHIWWNFVASSRERIEQAKRDWKEGRFAPVIGESEFIPLPE